MHERLVNSSAITVNLNLSAYHLIRPKPVGHRYSDKSDDLNIFSAGY